MKRNHYIIACLIIIGVILTPTIFFLVYFRDYVIGTDPEKWGQFGDFFGGTLNPIISLASLVTLGYLTYLVSTLSTQESKKLFILEMKMQAYDELVAMRLKLNLVQFDVRNASFLRDSKLPSLKRLEILHDEYKQVIQCAKVYSELFYMLSGFEMRYGHLFNYVFRDDKFKSLKDKSKKLMNQTDPSSDLKKNKARGAENIPNKEDSTVFFSELDQFIFGLKKELRG